MKEEEVKKEKQSIPSENVKSLRTYQSDIQDAIKQKQGSVLKIAVAEEERRTKEEISGTLRAPKNKSLFILSFIFLILTGLIVGSFFYFKKDKTPFTPPLSLEEYTTIKTDSVREIEITSLDAVSFLNSLESEWKGIQDPKDAIVRILLTQKNSQGQKVVVTPSELFSFLETRTTPALLRSFTESLLLGVTVSEKNNIFLLIKSNSYPNSFSGMLSWERALFDDMKTFFSIPAESVTNISLFKDKVVKNQDTRVLVDDTGKTVLLYTFLGEGQDLLLITNDESVVGIVTDRLTQAKIAQ